MTPFVDAQIGSAADTPPRDPYIDLEQRAESLALRLLRTFPPDAPDHAYHILGHGAERITAGELRALNVACLRARKMRP